MIVRVQNSSVKAVVPGDTGMCGGAKSATKARNALTTFQSSVNKKIFLPFLSANPTALMELFRMAFVSLVKNVPIVVPANNARNAKI